MAFKFNFDQFLIFNSFLNRNNKFGCFPYLNLLSHNLPIIISLLIYFFVLPYLYKKQTWHQQQIYALSFPVDWHVTIIETN